MNDISPLFAVEAEQLLLAGFTREAIDLCRKGLEQYPDYPTALAVLARAYEAAGDAGKAGEALRAAVELSPAQRNIRQMAGNFERFGRIAPQEAEQMGKIAFGGSETAPAEEAPASYDKPLEESSLEESSLEESSLEESSLEETPLEELLWDDSRVAEVEEFSAGTDAEGMDAAEDDESIAYAGPAALAEEKITIEKRHKPKLKDLITAMSTGEAEAPAGPDSSDIGLIPGLEFLVEDIARKEFEFKRPGIGLMHSIDVIESLRDKYPAGKATIDDDPFLKLAGKLENAKIPQATREVSSEPEPEEPAEEPYPAGSPAVVSETLANIYRLQGAYDNAIEAYSRLMEMYPEKAAEYSKKIDEIRQVITRDAAD